MNIEYLLEAMDSKPDPTTTPSQPADTYKDSIANFSRKGPKVDVCPLRPAHVPAMWAATMAGDPMNAKLFKQTYGMSCTNADMLASIIHARRREQTHFSFVVIPHATGIPSHWMTLHFPEDGLSNYVICARFLESPRRSERQVEGLYLVIRHLFDELRYETVEIRRASLERDHSNDGSWSLADVWRRTLLVPEKSQVSDVCVVSTEKWQVARLAAEAYLGMGGIDESGKGLFLPCSL